MAKKTPKPSAPVSRRSALAEALEKGLGPRAPKPLVLTNESFDRVVEMVSNPPAPNAALKKASRRRSPAPPPEPEPPAPEACGRCGGLAELEVCCSCEMRCCPECIRKKLCGVCAEARDAAGRP